MFSSMAPPVRPQQLQELGMSSWTAPGLQDLPAEVNVGRHSASLSGLEAPSMSPALLGPSGGVEVTGLFSGVRGLVAPKHLVQANKDFKLCVIIGFGLGIYMCSSPSPKSPVLLIHQVVGWWASEGQH